MKQILLMIAVVVLVGCASPADQALTKQVVGTYERIEGGFRIKWVVLKNGVIEGYQDGRKRGDYKWKLKKGEFVLYGAGDFTGFYKYDDAIWPRGGLINIGQKVKGKPREEVPAYAKRISISKVGSPSEEALGKAIRKSTVRYSSLLEPAGGALTKPSSPGLGAQIWEHVAKLELSRNQLTEAPKDLKNLTQLRVLVLDNNKLTDVKGLEKLTQLEELHLFNNQLTKAQICGTAKGIAEVQNLQQPPFNQGRIGEGH